MVNSVNSYSNSAYTGISNTKSIASSVKNNTATILGYKVDKDGYFTEEFNKIAGIPSDYKIYAKGAENLVRYISAHSVTHADIDFTKSLGNVYKLFSQIAPKTDGTSFSKEQISALPIGFEYDTKNFKVTKTYNYEEMQKLKDYTGTEKTQFAQIFPSQAGTSAYLQGKPSEDIFQSNSFINIGANAYKNADGSVEKGGVLMAFFSARIGQFEGSFLEGETTIRGKLAGLDARVSQEQLNDLQKFIEQNPIQYGSIDDLVARLKLKDSNLSIEDFKTEWLKLKEKSNKAQANSTQTTQNSNANGADNTTNSNTNSAKSTTNSPDATQTNTEQNPTKKRSPIQVTSKSEIYKDMDLSRLQNILKNQHKFDLINILFGVNSNATNVFNTNGILNSAGAFNTDGADLNTNLMNLNLSQIKPLSRVDIKA